jgi:DNA-binding CsgD family transcriptional regulator
MADPIIRRHAVRLLSECRESVFLLMHDDHPDPNSDLTRRALSELSSLRELDLRCVLPSRVALEPGRADWLTGLVGLGASIRCLPTVPMNIIVFDRRTALLAPPRPRGSLRREVSIVDGPDLMVALGAFCDFIWEKAVPANMGTGIDDASLTMQELGVLRLLAEGCTDQVVARRIGVSVRTAGRLTATLMNRLDARSRFQAGARAAQLGLLPLPAVPIRRCSDAGLRTSRPA